MKDTHPFIIIFYFDKKDIVFVIVYFNYYNHELNCRELMMKKKKKKQCRQVLNSLSSNKILHQAGLGWDAWMSTIQVLVLHIYSP
jgi:hypothetical protein